MATNTPKISIAFFAYNQEAYVREAVRSLLSQETEEPIQIILSDDCSPDTTFAILQEEVEAYQGRHQIILRQNVTNLGIGAHVREILKLATGDLVLMAAGDDVSMPNRAQCMLESWLDLGRPDGLFSNGYTINEVSKVIADSVYECTETQLELFRKLPEFKMADYIDHYGEIVTLGASSAWSKRLWKDYPAINDDVVNEDDVFSFRAGLGSGIRFLDKPLVKRRIHGANVWGARQQSVVSYSEALAQVKRSEWRLQAKLAVLRQAIADVAYCLDSGAEETGVLLTVKNQLDGKLQGLQQTYESHFGSYKCRVKGFIRHPRLSGLLSLLPRCVGCRMRALAKSIITPK
jgi:glycosyltransferase involved in cell wall biosynthesis